MTSASQQPVTVDDLRQIDPFDDLGDDALAEWAAVALWRHTEPGETLFEVGEMLDGMICLLEGTVRLFSLDQDRPEPIGYQRAPTWIGAVPVLTEYPVRVQMIAERSLRWALIPAEDFRRLALAHPAVHRRIMHQVAPLMGRIASMEQQREHLASLGTMAAGLAHELNNPAAAARRSASQLAEALDVIGATLREFVEAGIEREDAGRIAELREQAAHQAAERDPLSALGAADAEEEMQTRLEALGVADPWRVAEPLALAGVDQAWLDRLHELAGSATPAAIRYVAASLGAQKLVSELCESTERMHALIGAVKAYAYMDRGGLMETDINEGLETTLTVLGHKLKYTEIEVARDYDRALPRATVYGSELNQVWTNLLDNAIDAVGSSGRITLRTRRDGDCVLVDIADTGPGIAPDARDHVFEPFFTTKDVGKGTGLGLDTARRIVQERHGGSLTFETGEAGTTFHVWIPIQPSGPPETEKQS